LTFWQAIAKVEEDFWNRPNRKKVPRDKNNPSDVASWERTYETFFKQLPCDRVVNLIDVLQVVDKQKKGTRNKRYAVSAMRKLAEMNKRRDICDSLGDVNTIQTEFMDLQVIDLKEFRNCPGRNFKKKQEADQTKPV
jgi:hypothetical protein